MPKSSPPCAAIVDDHDRPKYHAPMQGVSVPGDKPCTRRATVRLGKLCLCATHLRLAQEGFLHEGGRVYDRGTIRDVRTIREGSRRRGVRRRGRPFVTETWQLKLTPEAL